MRPLRLLTVLCAALVTGLAFAHVMEMPQKMAYDSHRYAEVQHSLYAYFAFVGGPLEVLSIILAAVLAWRARGTAAFTLTLASALIFAAGLAEWAVVVQGANNAMAQWHPNAMPGNWQATRDQWEFGHLGHFVLFGIGLVLLMLPRRIDARPAR